MAMISSGTGVCSSPNEHLINSNVIIGKVLKGLYSAVPDYPWYGYYIVFVQFISYVALLYAFVKSEFSWMRVSFVLFYWIAVLSHFYVNMQFTTTAFLAGQSGVFLFISALDDKVKDGNWAYWRRLSASAFLLLLAALIRPDSFYLVVLMAVPLSLVKITMSEDRKRSVQHFIYGVCVLLVSLAAIYYNTYYYARDKGWNGFYERIALVSNFVNDGKAVMTEGTKPIFEDVHWSRNDYWMLMYWFFEDGELYSKNNMQQILSHFKEYKIYADMNYVKANILEVMKNRSVWIILCIFFISLFFVEKRKQAYVSIGFTFLLALGLIVFLILFKRIPERTYLAMFSFAAGTVLFYIQETRVLPRELSIAKIPDSLNTKEVLLIILVIIQLIVISGRYDESRVNKYKNSIMKQTVAQFNSDRSSLYVIWGASFPYEFFSPFDNLGTELASFRMLGINTLSNTPINAKVMAENQMKDVYKDLYEKDNLYLISNPYLNILYKQYVKEHHNKVVDFVLVFTSPLFSSFKVVVQP
ncbi:MAG: hypothetical protein ACYC69_04505 [Thermodesulfovibrionales bacterium]